MRMNPNHFDRFLDNIGQEFQWRRAFACTCVDPHSGAPDFKCPLCSGKGRIWVDPVDAKAASAGQKTQVQWAKMGLYETGDMVMTVPQSSPLWDAGQFDRVTMLNATDRFSQPMKRGAPTEKLMFTPKLIDRVFWLNPTTKKMVEGGIPTVDESGRLTWVDREPPPGMSYSISGTRLSEYFIYMDLPRNRSMHSGARLPKLTVLRRWDLFGR